MKSNIVFLFRFLIISVIYTLENVFIMPFFLFLDPRFFSFILVLYLTAIIASFLFSEEITAKIKIITDSVFLILFILTTLVLIIFDMGDADAVFFYIILYSPLMICFVVWFIQDIRKIKKEQSNDFFFFFFTYSHLQFIIRIAILSISYFFLNKFFDYSYLLSQDIFWYIIISCAIAFFVSLFVENKTVGKILILMNIFLLCIFCTNAMCMIGNSYIDWIHGLNRDVAPCVYEILTISPLVILFTIFLIRDIKYFYKS